MHVITFGFYSHFRQRTNFFLVTRLYNSPPLVSNTLRNCCCLVVVSFPSTYFFVQHQYVLFFIYIFVFPAQQHQPILQRTISDFSSLWVFFCNSIWVWTKAKRSPPRANKKQPLPVWSLTELPPTSQKPFSSAPASRPLMHLPAVSRKGHNDKRESAFSEMVMGGRGASRLVPNPNVAWLPERRQSWWEAVELVRL